MKIKGQTVNNVLVILFHADSLEKNPKAPLNILSLVHKGFFYNKHTKI